MRTLLLPALVLHGALMTADAAPINWQIDSNRTSITLAARYSDGTTSVAVIEQSPGSLTTSISGEVLTNVEFVSGEPVSMVIFPNSVTPIDNGVWRPGPGGSDVAASAFAAGRLFDPATVGDIFITLRDGSAGLRSGVLSIIEQSPGIYDVIGGTQATASAEVAFHQYDPLQPPLSFQTTIPNAYRINLAGPARLETEGSSWTMFLPLRFESSVFPFELEFSGEVVATALVPEPSAFYLAVFGILGTWLTGVWRKRCR